LKLGTVDNEFVTNLNVRDGQRVLAVEFTGVPDAGLAANPKCLANLDCYSSSYDSNKLFNKGVIQQQLNKSVSLCVVKPHVLKSNILSKVIGAILEGGFEISSMELHNMNKLEVDEIFEVYKGVLNDYVNMREHMISGPSVVCVIEKNENVVDEFRTLSGPHDPEIAK
jgi:nucleoside diphosphate kinase